MYLYRINDKLFLHEEEFDARTLQDLVSGMMMEYRREVVPRHKELAALRRENTVEARNRVKEMEKKIPSPYEFFGKWGFVLVNIKAEAKTNREVLENNEISKHEQRNEQNAE